MSHNRPRILIVDDDEDILANLSDILSDVGYEVETALTGQAALDKFDVISNTNQCDYELCLLDLKMPGMDGIELLEKIRTRHPDLRAILITAYAGDDGVERAESAGTWRILPKPVDIKLLLELIEEAVQV